ncbi:hypothetical protein DQ04_06981040 [Trypanosoma grayi]|uniref:hypothetical protein n=1 Tax=Trypanosoma grayi TaxID=71804 RepID=UPI0004F447D1|nr:hypothetical protein DQ04_06981040 [Trypanosoma grayi]KEG08530.1 hypothetical protein DQ04_06981040 [Trypanosoma grayi]
MLFFVVYGSRTFFRSAFDLLDDTVSGPLDYLNRTGERIIDFASDWSTGKRQPLDSIPLDLTALKTVHRTAMDSVELAREYQFKYFKWVSISTYCIGGLGFVLVALILPFAIFHCCIPWFPLILSCLYWVSGLVFSLLGVIFTLLAYAFFIGCGEVDLHYQRQPGLSQWYAVPYCQREFNFNKINAEIHATELQYSQQACSQLLDVCDNGAEISQAPLNVYAIKELSDLPVNVTEVIGSKVLDKVSKLPLNTTNITDFSEKNLSDLHDQLSKIPEGMEILKELNLLDKVDLSGGVPKFRGDLSKELQKIIRPLICGMDIVSADQCTNFGTVAAVLLTTKVKSFAKACPNPASTCSLPECAVNCTNNFVKSKAAEIVHKAHVAQNISIALSYARPLLDCNFVLDTAASALARCPDLRDGSLMLGVGFFVGGLTCALAIYIAFRGACIWSRPPLKRQRSLTSKEN